MTEKNRKQETVTYDLFKHVGCSFLLIPATLVASAILIRTAIIMFQSYFFGIPAAFVEPFQDPTYLILFVIIMLTLFMVLRATWHILAKYYGTFTQYRRMRVETSRIERLHLQDKPKHSRSESQSLDYLEDEAQQKSKR